MSTFHEGVTTILVATCVFQLKRKKPPRCSVGEVMLHKGL